LAAACAYPVSTIDQGGGPSGVYFPDAPAGSSVDVDGARLGNPAAHPAAKTPLLLASGRHRIVVRGPDGAVIYDREIYLGDGSQIAVKVYPQ
jgi:sugar/nucleoside kinase (ribokinase family)